MARSCERGFVGLLSILLTLAIICFLASFYLKSVNRQPVTTVDSDGNVRVRISGGTESGPVALVQRAKEQVAVYNQTVNDRANFLNNISAQ